MTRYLSLVWLAALGMCSPTSAQDWPQWRGPNRDGHSIGKPPTAWPKSLKTRWAVEVGEGHASPIIVGERVFVHARKGDQESLQCLQLTNGKLVWEVVNPAPYEMNTHAVAHGKGPKSTPVYADGKIVTLGISGILSCVEAASGKLLWRHDFVNEFPQTSPLYGTAMSPIVHQGQVIAHVGGHDKGSLNAFDLTTGKIRWRAVADGPGYSSPIIAKLDDKTMLVTFTQSHLVGIDPTTGTTHFREPYTTAYDQNSITPIMTNGLLIFSGYERPLTAVRVQNGKLREVWSMKKLPLYMSSPVAVGKRVVGFTQREAGKFFSIDAETGKIAWESEGRLGENALLLVAGENVVALTTNATLYVFPAAGDRFAPIATYSRLADSETWAHPALSGRLLLIKDKTKLTARQLDE